MNLAIRGIDSSQVKWNNEGSFLNDRHKDLKADYVIANPPFNDSDWSGDLLRKDGRWKYGTPPTGKANYAWIQHFLYHLSPSGQAGFVLAKGSLTSKTSGEGDIRKALIEARLMKSWGRYVASLIMLREELGTPFSFAVLSALLCFLQIFPFILFCLDSSTIYLSYPSTIFRSYRAGGAGRINWSDFFFDGVGQFYCPLTALHSGLPLLFSRSRLQLALRFAPALQIEPHDSALLSR
jgi:hypothetical protein